ncbi:MAG: transposase family protein [Planctomycetia bacterium]|nr:transposase family protein [Planctomycetia bacterium]
MRVLWKDSLEPIRQEGASVRDLSCGDARIYLEVEVRRVLCRKCEKVKREN